MGRRTSVSAESMNPTDSGSDKWSPPYHAKTAEQLERLRESIGQHTLFRGLEEKEMGVVIGALVEKVVPVKNIKVSLGPFGQSWSLEFEGVSDVWMERNNADWCNRSLRREIKETSSTLSSAALSACISNRTRTTLIKPLWVLTSLRSPWEALSENLP